MTEFLRTPGPIHSSRDVQRRARQEQAVGTGQPGDRPHDATVQVEFEQLAVGR